MTNQLEQSPQSEIDLHQTEDGQTRIHVRLENGTVWLTQQHMAELFQCHRSVIPRHIRSILKEGELQAEAVAAKCAAADDGEDDYFDGLLYRIRDIRSSELDGKEEVT